MALRVSWESVDPQARRIHQLAADYFRIKNVDDITGPARHHWVALARHVAMYVIRLETRASFPAIGMLFGKRDHTSVLHACKKIRIMCEARTSAAAREAGKTITMHDAEKVQTAISWICMRLHNSGFVHGDGI